MPRRTVGFQFFGKRFEIEYVGNRRDDSIDAEPDDIPREAPTQPAPRWNGPTPQNRPTLVTTPPPPIVHEPTPTIAPAPTTPVSLDARRTKLARAIEAEIARGWTITALSDTSAALTRRGPANGFIAIVLLLLAILPGVLYALLARPTYSLFLTVDEFGQGQRTVSPGGENYSSPWPVLLLIGGILIALMLLANYAGRQ